MSHPSVGSGFALNVSRKVAITGVTGGFTYLLTEVTNFAASKEILALILSAFIGGVTLVVQFLIDFERRVGAVEAQLSNHATEMERQVADRVGAVEARLSSHATEMEHRIAEGFSKISEATELFGLVEASALRPDAVTQLVKHSTKLDPGMPQLMFDFAQSEIGRWSDFLKELSEGGDVTYEGEDRDWLLALARNVKSKIDATSLTTVDAGGKGFVDGGLWMSDLGQRYLEVQRDAVLREVDIRRVFILDRPELAKDPDFIRVWRLQKDIGVIVRVLDPSAIPGLRKSSLFDFVLFDDVISYETTPASRIENEIRPTILNTRLELRVHRVRERIARFKDLWDSAHELE